MPGAFVGKIAPEFELPLIDAAGNQSYFDRTKIQSDWIALLFYPRDFSFICPTELVAISARIEEFESRNCQVIGISIDDLETHREWLKTSPDDGGVGPLRFPLAADVDGTVSKSFGVWNDNLELAHRALFMIDRNGIIQYSLVHGPTVGRNVDEMVRILDAVNSGGLCPVSWTAADGTIDVKNLLKPGRTLGHYRIQAELGNGTFGTVFKALDLRLRRDVAVKILNNDNTSVAKDRLLKEARSAASIRHENVCTIYSVDEIDGLPLIVMDYLDGPSLSEYPIAQSWEEQRVLMQQLLAGLDAAHRASVVHGDLKPGNVLMDNGKPVIVDFGLAFCRNCEKPTRNKSNKIHKAASVQVPDAQSASTQAASSQSSASRRIIGQSTKPADDSLVATVELTSPMGVKLAEQRVLESLGVTRENASISGTLAYMAPEVLLTNRKDEASDVFSLGVMFVEILTGRKNILGESFNEIFTNLQRDNLPQWILTDVQSPINSLLEQILSHDPTLRPTATECLALLIGQAS